MWYFVWNETKNDIESELSRFRIKHKTCFPTCFRQIENSVSNVTIANDWQINLRFRCLYPGPERLYASSWWSHLRRCAQTASQWGVGCTRKQMHSIEYTITKMFIISVWLNLRRCPTWRRQSKSSMTLNWMVVVYDWLRIGVEDAAVRYTRS